MLLGGFCSGVVSGAQNLWRKMRLLAGGGREGHCSQEDVVVRAPVALSATKPVKKAKLPINVW